MYNMVVKGREKKSRRLEPVREPCLVKMGTGNALNMVLEPGCR